MMQDLPTSMSGHVMEDKKTGSCEMEGEDGKMSGRVDICRTLE